MKIKYLVSCLIFLITMSCTSYSQKFIGLQLYSVRDTMSKDVKGTLAAIGKMGYKFVEAANYKDGKLYGMEPTEFKAICNANGLVLLGSHAQHAAPDSASWNSVMAWWDQCIDAHVNAGVKYIVQPYMADSAYKSITALDLYCRYFNEIGEKCNAKGIRFGFHNHNHEFQKIGAIIIYDYILQHTDPAKVMMEMDLYWIKKGGADPLAYFDKYPGRFHYYHVKDETELGASGKTDFKPYFDNAGKAGMKNYIIEVEERNYSSLESVKRSFDFLNNADYAK